MRDPDGYLIEVDQSTGLRTGKLAKKARRSPRLGRRAAACELEEMKGQLSSKSAD